MRRLLAIMMALVMCCSLVISASAADTYSGTGFDITIDVDGEWYDYGSGIYDFSADDGTYLEIYVYSVDELKGYTPEEIYEEYLAEAYETAAEIEESEGQLAEGSIAGYDAFILEEIYDNSSESLVYICTDNYLFEISLEGNGDDDTYNSLAESVLDIAISDNVVEDDYVDDDADIDEDDNTADDEDDASSDDKDDKDSDNDDKDSKEDDKNSDKEDKKDDKEDDGKDNTTLIIVIVAGVAVVAVAAVVIVVVTKKKK